MDFSAEIAAAVKASESSQEQSTAQEQEVGQEVKQGDPQQDNSAPSSQEAEDSVSQKPDSDLTPEQLAKREANRQSHANSRQARLKREVRELREEINQLKSQTGSKVVADNAPKEEDYDNLLDFLKATVKHEDEVASKSTPLKQGADAGADKAQAEIARKVSNVVTQEAKFLQQVPEYASLLEENKYFFESVPQDFKDCMLEAENAPLALYALMKEGRLDDLEGMKGARLAIEIGKAEERGAAYLANKNKPKQPEFSPISQLKGASSAKKSDYDLPMHELLKKFNGR